MTNFFDSIDLENLPPLSPEVVDAALAQPDKTAGELLMLYFSCVAIEPVESEEFGGLADEIADAMFEMAEAGDEEAMMAMTALTSLMDPDGTEEATLVGVAMFKAVAHRPILRNVITGNMDFETAATALSVIDTLASGFLGEDFDLDDMDDDDLDELFAALGVDASDLDWDGDPDDR